MCVSGNFCECVCARERRDGRERERVCVCVIRVCMCESVDSPDPQLYEARCGVLLLEGGLCETEACFKPILWGLYLCRSNAGERET